MAPADDDNEEPVPWRTDPGRSETRWEPERYARPLRRSSCLPIAVGIVVVVVIIIIVLRYLLFS
jgi:hypothetical protein